MIDIMNHRGPDSRGFFLSESVHLGHCRLSINDLSDNASQPFVSEDKNIAVVVNGEIYNFLKIRNKLLKKGYKFKSESDSEIVIHGYIEFGEALFNKLNGMFAIAIWIEDRKELLLVRDRLGIKPLYYSYSKENITFASELKAVAQNLSINLTMDGNSFSEYLMFENYFSNRTLNQNIKIVKPGEIITFNSNTSSLTNKTFWNSNLNDKLKHSKMDLYERYREILDRSVSRHLLSDVPLGFYLSAGFDSSSVVSCASEKLNSDFDTYTGHFGMTGFYDESESSEQVSQYYGCRNSKVRITPDDFENNIEKILWHLDEPRVGMGSFSQYMVANRASQDVKVILTGHGGDEFFAGYPVFKAIYGKKKLSALLFKSSLREKMFAAYFLLFPLLKKENDFFLPNLFSFKDLKTDLKEGFYNHVIQPNDPLAELTKLKESCKSDYERLILTYIRFYLPALFNVEDKISMAFSLESRTPLCDNEMLDFALSVPLSEKLKNLELKHIPKTAMKGSLPGFLYSLPKRGFPTPLSYWFKNELKGFVREFILDNYKYIDMFKKYNVESIISKVQNSKFNTPLNVIPAHKVWILLNLVVYFRNQKNRYKSNAA